MIDLRTPHFTGTLEEKLTQISDYLFQLYEQLQFALNEIDHEVVTATEQATMAVQRGGSTTVIKSDSGVPKTEEDIQETFNNIKALIIKSGEIANAYYDKIVDINLSRRKFTIESEFGTYQSDVEAMFQQQYDGAMKFTVDQIEKVVTPVKNNYDVVQNEVEIAVSKINAIDKQSTDKLNELEGKVNGSDAALANMSETYNNTGGYAKIIKSGGYMKVGLIDGGTSDEDFGIELGYERDINGVTDAKRYAKFATKKVVFYDQNGNEGASLSDETLEADQVQVNTKFAEGEFVNTYDSKQHRVVTKWIGNVEV